MVMHFHFSFFSISAIAVVLSSQQGFVSSLNILPDSETSFLDDSSNNDDLFADSTIFDLPTELTPGLDALEGPPFELLASCPSTNEQPASKVRSRDQFCLSNGNQPSSIDGFTDNALGIFGDSAAREEQLQGAAAASSTKINGAPVCSDPKHPVHLCCEYEGDETDMVLSSPPLGAYDMIYATMDNCQPGTWIIRSDWLFFSYVLATEEFWLTKILIAVIIPCVFPQDKEVCCERSSYPFTSPRHDAPIANLQEGTPEAIGAYLQSGLAQLNIPPWLRGNKCYYFGIGLYRGSP